MKLILSRSARCFVILCLGCIATTCVAQDSANQVQSLSFPPLEQWKAAVIKRDAAALTALYAPGARISTPKAELDVDGDVAFWTGLKVRKLRIDIAQSQSPDPDRRQMVLKMEIHSAGESGEHISYLSAAQIWGREGDQWRLTAVKRTDAARLEQPLVVSNDIYSPGSDAHAKIKAALAGASAGHKRVIIVFGANWCYDCHVLDTAFHRSDLAAVLSKNYEVVHVDVGRGDANQDLMEQYQVPMKKGIPGLAVLDSDGKLLYSQENGEFENARTLGPEDLLAFLNKWKPTTR